MIEKPRFQRGLPRTPAKKMFAPMPKAETPGWNKDTGMEGGKYKTADEVIAEAEKPSPAYEARRSGGLPTVKPPMTTPAGRAVGAVAAAKPVMTMASPPPDPAPMEQKQSSPSRAGLLKKQVAAKMPIASPRAVPVPTEAPDGDILSNEDMSAKGYTLIGSKGGQKKWRKGAEMSAMNKSAADQTAANVVKSPVFRGRPDAPKTARPLETATKMVGDRPMVVQTGGDSTPEFDRLKAAQARNAAGTSTADDEAMVQKSLSGDVLGRQPQQVAQVRADERAGRYQAGRRVR
jgi:hypothetical protein